MTRHGIPTARYRVVRVGGRGARGRSRRGELGLPVVVKADGLAAGKGVVVAATRRSRRPRCAPRWKIGSSATPARASSLEECLVGPEVSFFALCDGTHARCRSASAQDHKRIFDGDRGPNTGGMGAFAPSPLLDDAHRRRASCARSSSRCCAGMRAEGHEYRGFLYAGLMLTCDGPKVIEFNVRFGDPEAQAVLPLIESDLLPTLLAAAADGDLGERRVALRSRCGRRRRARLGRLSRVR